MGAWCSTMGSLGHDGTLAEAQDAPWKPYTAKAKPHQIKNHSGSLVVVGPGQEMVQDEGGCDPVKRRAGLTHRTFLCGLHSCLAPPVALAHPQPAGQGAAGKRSPAKESSFLVEISPYSCIGADDADAALSPEHPTPDLPASSPDDATKAAAEGDGPDGEEVPSFTGSAQDEPDSDDDEDEHHQLLLSANSNDLSSSHTSISTISTDTSTWSASLACDNPYSTAQDASGATSHSSAATSLPPRDVRTATSLPPRDVRTATSLPPRDVRTATSLPARHVRTATSLPARHVRTAGTGQGQQHHQQPAHHYHYQEPPQQPPRPQHAQQPDEASDISQASQGGRKGGVTARDGYDAMSTSGVLIHCSDRPHHTDAVDSDAADSDTQNYGRDGAPDAGRTGGEHAAVDVEMAFDDDDEDDRGDCPSDTHSTTSSQEWIDLGGGASTDTTPAPSSTVLHSYF